MRRVFLTCLLVVPVPVFAEAAEVQVNIRPAGDQKNAAVATSAAGGSVIVWASYYSTPGRSYDILARRLNSQGGFLGNEFLVNAVTQGNQNEPAVAMDGPVCTRPSSSVPAATASPCLTRMARP